MVFALQQVVYGSFVLLSLLTVRDWLKNRDQVRTRIAIALSTLAVVVLVSDADTLTSTRIIALQVATQVIFPWSGYAFLLVRDAFVPLSKRARRIAGVLVAAISIAGAYFGAQVDAHGARLPLPNLYYGLWLAIWIACVGEPIVRFWLEAGRRRAVQRARLRALSSAYGLVILILIFSYATRAEASNTSVQLAIQAASLIVVPTLYAGFAPPLWLRVIWRQSEDRAFVDALNELVHYSADPAALAARSLDWGVRLLGAEAGLILEPDGNVIAAQGESPVSTAAIRAKLAARAEADTVISTEFGLSALMLPIRVEAGLWWMVLLAGPTTPFFGDDEIARLQQYVITVSAALERVRLSESVRSLNQTLELRVQARTQALEEKTRELEAFSYTVSHDLRAPIRVMGGFAAALEDDYGAEIPPGALRYVQRIAQNSLSMGSLIDSVLAFTRLGQQQMRTSLVALTPLVKHVLDMYEGQLDQSRTTVRVGELPPVQGDPQLLELVFSNLIGNALKFSAKVAQPTVEIGVDPTDADGAPPVFYVRDNGAGFDMRHADKLFQVFQRLHGKDEFEGHGAGLAIAKRIVERHGGRIWADSEIGNGATFYFTLAEG